MNHKNKDKDFKNLFNLHYIMGQLVNFAAYIIAILSGIILLYISLIDTLKIEIDWTTLEVFVFVAVFLAWLNWNNFYRKHFEKVMDEDIEQHELGKYSIHSRYYMAIRDFSDAELQKCIDDFNDEYEKRWLKWVEKITGKPIETITEKIVDANGNEILDPITGEPQIKVTKGIKDLPYRKFKHKILMWRVKTHHYPQSGYRTAMELMSLLSFQDSDLSQRKLNADKKFYYRKSVKKVITTLLCMSLGGSLVPEIINGNIWLALLKALLAIGTLLTSILMGSMNGIRGARLKLSILEDVCGDLERWQHKKPILAPYTIVESSESKELKEPTQTKMELDSLDNNIQAVNAVENIFNQNPN